jgi:RNA polymerase sigma-70 factor (ECF subfamily)
MEPMDPALDALLRESGWLTRLARALSADPHRAEEAVQETLVAALEHPGTPRRSLRGWLRAVLRSKLVQQGRADARRARREQESAAARPGPGPGDTLERLELQEVVARAVRALDEPYRSTLVARYLDELAPAAIARRDGVPVRTVHTRLVRGLARLRERLGARLGTSRMQAWMLWLAAPVASGTSGPLTAGPLAGGVLVNSTTKVVIAAAGLAGLVWFAVGQTREGGTRGRRGGVGEVAPVGVAAAAPESRELPELRAGLAPRAERTAGTVDPGSSGPTTQAVATALPTDAPSGVRVSVRRQSDGRAIGGVKLSAAPRESGGTTPRPEARATTGVSGQATLSVGAGRDLRISCVAPVDSNHPVQQVTVDVAALTAGEFRPLEVTMPDGFDVRFHGRVVAAADGRPLPDAALVRFPSRGPDPEIAPDGGFEVPYASWTPDELEVRCAGYATVRLHLERVDQAPGEPHVVALERAGSVEGVLALDADPELTLLLRTPDGREWNTGFDELRTARLEELPVRVAFQAELRAGGRTLWRDPESFELAPGEHRVLELAPGRGCLLFGLLVDEHGVPIGDHGVVAFPASDREGFKEDVLLALGDRQHDGMVRATLDGHGGYEFLALPEGRWWIGPESTGDELAAWARGVVIGPGSHARRLDLVAEHGAWIEGVVLGPDGKPVPGCRIVAQRSGDRGQVATQSSDGHFVLGPLKRGEYALRAMAEGAFGWGEPLRVAAGAQGVELRLTGDGTQGTIAGRVVDEAGRGVKAHVHLLMPRRGSLGTSTTGEGTFLLTGIEPGEYGVSAALPDGRTAVLPVTLERGENLSGLVLELRPGGRVVITHDLETSARVALWVGDVLAADSTVRAGEETFEVVPAGRVRVELYGGGRTLAERTLHVRSDRVERADFQL